MFGTKNVNVKQLQQDAFKRGQQLQYEKDVKKISELTERLNTKHIDEIESLKNKFQKKYSEAVMKLEKQAERESTERLIRYKTIVTEKESIIKEQSHRIKELEKDNKRLKKAITAILDLKEAVLCVLDELKTYYNTIESSTLTMKQKLSKMSDILTVANSRVKKNESDIRDLVHELDTKSEAKSLTLIEGSING